jgi:hypothetical protein
MSHYRVGCDAHPCPDHQGWASGIPSSPSWIRTARCVTRRGPTTSQARSGPLGGPPAGHACGHGKRRGLEYSREGRRYGVDR